MSTGKRKAGAGAAKATPASTAPKAPAIPGAVKADAPQTTPLNAENEAAKAIESQQGSAPQEQPGAEVVKTGQEAQSANPDGKPSATVIPQAKAPDAPIEKTESYIKEFNRSVELFGVMPLDSLTEQELKSGNDAKELEVLKAQIAADKTGAGAEQTKTIEVTQTAAVPEEDNDNYVFAEKNGDRMRFTKATWKQMEKAPDGWKLVPVEPKEVKELKK